MDDAPFQRIEIEQRGDIVISHWPEEPTVPALHAFFDEMERLLHQRPRALIINALSVKTAPISVRETAGRRLKVMEELLRSALRGQATVLSSPLVRGALATVHFFARPKYPAQTFACLEEAIIWAEKQLAVSRSGGYRASS
jgi:hypothetical protein